MVTPSKPDRAIGRLNRNERAGEIYGPELFTGLLNSRLLNTVESATFGVESALV